VCLLIVRALYQTHYEDTSRSVEGVPIAHIAPYSGCWESKHVVNVPPLQSDTAYSNDSAGSNCRQTLDEREMSTIDERNRKDWARELDHQSRLRRLIANV